MHNLNFSSGSYPEQVIPTKKWDFVDPSKMNTFLTCPRKFFYEYILGWRPESVNKHFVFGTAWHLAMEHLSLNGYGEESQREAYEKFLKYYREYFSEITDLDQAPKNPGNAKLAIEEYCNKYEKIDSKLETLYTEILTSVPVSSSGRMMIGRMDKISYHPELGIIGFDFKTGSYRSSMWEKQWKTSVQMSYYYHVLNLAFPGQHIYGIIVDGVFFYKRQQKNADTRNIPVRVPVRKTNDMHRAFLSDLNLELDMLEWNFDGLSKASADDQTMSCFPRRPTSCTMYNHICLYHDFCTSWANPLKYCAEVPMGFKKEFWHPAQDETKPAPKTTFNESGFIKKRDGGQDEKVIK